MSGASDLPRDFDLEAAEYVLGTLDALERAEFERQLRDDAAAARAVTAWERRLASLADRLEPVDPPAAMWQRIERCLPGSSTTRQHFEIIDGDRPTERLPKLTASRDRWRAAAMGFGALAAALAVFIVAGLSHVAVAPGPAGERYIAAINRGGDKPALLVRVDLGTRQILVMPVAAEAPAGRSLELWYIGGGKPPLAMGLVDRSPATMPIPADASAAGATFAVSVEPPGGSKTGGPTGPVVYSGQLVKE